jgi:tight adherence protein C
VTFLLFIIGVALVGASGRLIARAIVVPRLQLKLHLREIRDYGFEGAPTLEQLPAKERLRQRLRHTAERTGRFAIKNIPNLKPLARGDLSAAGFYTIAPETVHGYRVLAAILLPTLFLVYVLLVGGGLSLLTLLLIAGGAGAGLQLPAFLIKRRGRARLYDIDRQLPELMDLLIATVEAGMGFAASIALVANRLRGALGDELRLTLKQQSLGISNQQALEDMVERCGTTSVRAFVRTIIRSEAMGVSMGPILRELASDMRRRRRQSAREKMQKAPVKMIFPLMFLIMPALMIVLLYPAAYSVMHNLSGL